MTFRKCPNLTGGISETVKIAAMADVYNLHVQPHNCGGPVATAAAVQIAFAIPNFIIMEWFPYWRDGDIHLGNVASLPA